MNLTSRRKREYWCYERLIANMHSVVAAVLLVAIQATGAWGASFAPSSSAAPAGRRLMLDSSSYTDHRHPPHSSTVLLHFATSTPPDEGLVSTTRRQLGEVTLATLGLGITYAGLQEKDPTEYGLWGIFPVGTYKSKKTIQETIIPDQLWTLEQKFGILNVQVPLRMVIVRLSPTVGGGLFVYNPIATTKECLQYIQELVDQYGPIRHIAVGSVALEHKVYAGVMAQKFPQAQVWLTPGQYSFPIELPNVYLGFPPGRTQLMPKSIEEAPAEWKVDLDFAILGPIISRDGSFAENVFYYKPTKTLLVTDTAVQVDDVVPPIYQYDHKPLLYHARDTITDLVQDTPETLRKGWKRVVMFGLYFTPSAITIKDLKLAFDERRPDINPDFAGIYPWDWVGDEEASWKALTGSKPTSGPLVAPILQVLLLSRSPVEVLDFADKVSRWDFNRIIPAHLKNNIRFNGKQYRKSFGFLEESGVPEGYPKPLKADLQTLESAEVNLLAGGVIAPRPPKVGGTYSRAEIIAKTTYRCRGRVCAPRATE